MKQRRVRIRGVAKLYRARSVGHATASRTVGAEPLLGFETLLAAVKVHAVRRRAAQPIEFLFLANRVSAALGLEAFEHATLVVETRRVLTVYESVPVVVDLVVTVVLLGLETLEAA
jgi:hypothetical protein